VTSLVPAVTSRTSTPAATAATPARSCSSSRIRDELGRARTQTPNRLHRVLLEPFAAVRKHGRPRRRPAPSQGDARWEASQAPRSSWAGIIDTMNPWKPVSAQRNDSHP
jgi:hypothetical protein